MVARAREPMERLSRATGETVHLVAREGAEIVYVYKVESIHGAIRMVSCIGMRRPPVLYRSGEGHSGHRGMRRCSSAGRRASASPAPLHHHPEGRLPPGDRPDPAAGLGVMDNEENELGCAAQRRPSRTGTGLRPMPLSISAPGVPHDRRAGPQSDPRPCWRPERDLRPPGGGWNDRRRAAGQRV